MEYIAHRINTTGKLLSLDSALGLELDLRDGDKKLILSHDPFESGECFLSFLKEYNHQTIILNIKSEGIESKVIEALQRYKIQNYFFLDCSYPMINNLIKNDCNKIALRFSEYECRASIKALATKVEWVWVDCFNSIHFTKLDIDYFKSLGLKTCLVSPDLIQQEDKIPKYAQFLRANNISFDAICCKPYNVDLWKNLLGDN